MFVCVSQLVPPVGMLNNPMNAVTTKFVRTSTNKVKCPVFVIRVSRPVLIQTDYTQRKAFIVEHLFVLKGSVDDVVI